MSEIALGGGRVTPGVVRVGDTVRRPAKANTPFVRILLAIPGLHLTQPPPPVAVGTAVASRPPHRSQRAGLPHWAPALGAGGESLLGPGMQNPRLR